MLKVDKPGVEDAIRLFHYFGQKFKLQDEKIAELAGKSLNMPVEVIKRVLHDTGSGKDIGSGKDTGICHPYNTNPNTNTNPTNTNGTNAPNTNAADVGIEPELDPMQMQMQMFQQEQPYSGADIENMCRECVLQVIRSELIAQ